MYRNRKRGRQGSKRGVTPVLTVGLVAVIALVFGMTQALAKTPAKKKAPATSTKPPSAATISKNLAKLYAQAKLEGTVDVDVLTSPTAYTAAVAGFEAKYPGITVNTVNVAGPALASSLVSQAATHNLSIDLAEARPEVMGPIIQRNLVAVPDWAGLGVATKKILLGGKLLHTSDFVTGVIYNTKLVTPAELPHSWDDLLSTQWAGGKIVVDGEGTEGFESMLLSKKWTTKQYTDFLSKLEAQKPLVIYQGAPETIAVSQGQAAIGLAPFPIVSSLVAKGAPLAIAPVQPVISSPDGWFVLKGAPHSAAATLLASYLASPAAQPLLAQGGFTYAKPSSLGGEAGVIGAGGVTQIVGINTSQDINVFNKAEGLNISYLGFNG